jgi:hypothetical protein
MFVLRSHPTIADAAAFTRGPSGRVRRPPSRTLATESTAVVRGPITIPVFCRMVEPPPMDFRGARMTCTLESSDAAGRRMANMVIEF